MLEGGYDVAEMAFSMLLSARHEGYPLVALPVFTTRRFMQPHIHLSRRSHVQDLSQLKGRRVGLHLYWNSDYLWVRSLLREIHGVAPEDIIWITRGPERMPSQLIPPGVTVQQDEQGRDTPRLLAEGAIDAVVGLGAGGRPQQELPLGAVQDMRRDAYPNVLEAQRSYYRQTGIYPMMNVVAMREQLATEEPWVVESLYEMFVASKEHIGAAGALAYLHGTGHWPLGGGTEEDVRELLGKDTRPYGVKANRRSLEHFLAEALRQGMIDKPMPIERLIPGNIPE
jgi:4,5-dihydroxyphthalate decarboxylase